LALSNVFSSTYRDEQGRNSLLSHAEIEREMVNWTRPKLKMIWVLWSLILGSKGNIVIRKKWVE
jgi:hypothetical protein